jgi:2-methylisocitrate lyase-like PEP mutase family enzyme
MPSVEEKRRTFRALHAQGCFVIPNPWDLGSARWLQHLGFAALATTSAGVAFARGVPDAALGREVVLAHLRELAAGSDVPVNADFQAGYGAAPDDVAASVRLAVETGIAGLSIEDASGDPAAPLFPLDVAVARLAAARRAIDAAGGGVLLTGRSEGFICGRPDLPETLRRLRAYAAAGADVLYAPGLPRDAIAAAVSAVAPRPVNVLVAGDGITVAELAALGVRRVSVGSSLARVAFHAFARAAEDILRTGRFGAFAGITSFAALDGFFREDLARRQPAAPR